MTGSGRGQQALQCQDQNKVLLIDMKFGGVFDLILKNRFNFFENFSLDRKLDGVQQFSFYDHMFKAFRMQNSPKFSPTLELVITTISCHHLAWTGWLFSTP